MYVCVQMSEESVFFLSHYIHEYMCVEYFFVSSFSFLIFTSIKKSTNRSAFRTFHPIKKKTCIFFFNVHLEEHIISTLVTSSQTKHITYKWPIYLPTIGDVYLCPANIYSITIVNTTVVLLRVVYMGTFTPRTDSMEDSFQGEINKWADITLQI